MARPLGFGYRGGGRKGLAGRMAKKATVTKPKPFKMKKFKI